MAGISGLPSALRKILRMAAAVAAGLGVRGWLGRRKTIERVAPELRSAALWMPLSLDNRVALAVGRRVGDRASPVRRGVSVDHHRVQAPDAPTATRVVSYLPPHRVQPSGALLWMHGGGMILGGPEYDHDWCSALADDLALAVFSVDYRLAPENPFPAALDDCFSALSWLHHEASAFGISPDRIAVGGASGGGGLAAALAQRTSDHDVPVCFQLLRYPMLDDRTALRRDHDGRGRFVWTPATNRYAWTCYLGRLPGSENPPEYAAPARRRDLSGLPPAWIGVGDLDLFRDEDVDYARRLQRAGVACELLVEDGMYHGADEDHADVPSMIRFRTAATAALRSAMLGPET